MDEFGNWIENVIESKLDQAIKTIQESWDVKTEELLNKVEQKHNSSEQQVQERQDKLEVNLNTKIEQMFQLKSQELNKMIEEKLDEKYKKVKEKFLEKLTNKNTESVNEQDLMMKINEKIDLKAEELSVNFQAQIIRELEQVMGVIQQILNNGLDLDKNIEKELTGKFKQFLDSNKQKFVQILDEELKNEAQKNVEAKQNELDLSVKEKINKAIDQILANQSQELSMKFKKFVNVACKEVLEEKIAGLKSNEPAAAEATVANLNRIEVSLDKFVKRVEDVETKLNHEKLSKPRNTKGRYVNWTDEHNHLWGKLFISIPELNEILFKVRLMEKNTAQSEVRNMFNSLNKMYKVEPTVRFPDGIFLSLETCEGPMKDIVNSFQGEYYVLGYITNLKKVINYKYNRITLNSFENEHGLQWSYDDVDQLNQL